MKKLNSQQIQKFRQTIFKYYQKHARTFPWREIDNPYAILVSEIMLQQTQTERVIPKYQAWLKQFPTVEKLANSSFNDVLTLWQGLGYNRRALALHNCAKEIVKNFQGKIPSDPKLLQKLPGIGSYTAHAISTFANNQRCIFIETNIRSVFIHFFFTKTSRKKFARKKSLKDTSKIINLSGIQTICDTEILPLIKQTLDRENPRQWYYALMDYGAMLKKKFPNPNRSSKNYRPQSPFAGSNRQLRGQMLQTLIKKGTISFPEFLKKFDRSPEAILDNLKKLEKEGFLVQDKDMIKIKYH